jgi:hypothetical protein
MVTKASFLLMILVEGNAQKVMVVEMESGGMEALVRAEVSVVKMFNWVDWRGFVELDVAVGGVSEVDDVERLEASRVHLRKGWELGGCARECMLRWLDICEARSSSVARRS